jgi:hypothetical protein
MTQRDIFKRPLAEQQEESVKVAIVVVREYEEFAEANLVPFIERLKELGCSTLHIQVREITKLHDSIMMIQYIAQYTDADSVIILAPEQEVMTTPALMDGIVQQQLLWNMYITMGGQERADDMQEMYLTMREMEASAPNFDAEQQEELNISFS